MTFTVPYLGHHQVRRLQVAVHDAGAVRMRERVEHLHREVRGLRRRERAEPLGQFVHGLATHELHHHQQIVIVPIELVERRYTGMIEPREGDGFGAKPLEDVGVAKIGVEDLDRDFAVERLVDRLVHGPHTAPPEAFDDAVLADCFTDHDLLEVP